MRNGGVCRGPIQSIDAPLPPNSQHFVKPQGRVREPVSRPGRSTPLQFFILIKPNHEFSMYTIVTLLIYAAAAELFRRCCLILLTAFTGPLSKIPGPMIGKFTSLPWIISCIKGNQMNIGPGLFKKYGDIVRVGEEGVIPQNSTLVNIFAQDQRMSCSQTRLAFRRSSSMRISGSLVTTSLFERTRISRVSSRRLTK